jgi:hypothetical protein
MTAITLGFHGHLDLNQVLEEADMTAQVHERLLFEGEETSMACCPPLPEGAARIVKSDPEEMVRVEAQVINFSTGCWRP